MVVQVQTMKVLSTGNGVAFEFSFSPMELHGASSELVVTLLTVATGAETAALTEGTGAANYSVAVDTYPGTGSITYPADSSTALTSATKVVMRRVLVLEQQTDLGNQKTYYADVQEKALDRLLKIDQQQQEQIDRSIKFPAGYEGDVGVVTASPVGAALKYMRVNVDEDEIEFAAQSTATASASDASPQAVSVSAAAAGTGGSFARDDHVHLLSVPLSFANTIARVKTGTRLALYNHVL